MNEMIIDAENAVLGRLASYIAKQVLLGKEVRVVNSEKAIVVGNEKDIIERYKKKKARGGSSSIAKPHFPSTPERIIKRTIRNMLPYKKYRGREASKKVVCYSKIPKEFEGKKMIKSSGKRTGVSLGYISKMLRGIKK